MTRNGTATPVPNIASPQASSSQTARGSGGVRLRMYVCARFTGGSSREQAAADAGPILGRVLEQGIYHGDNLELLARLPDEAFTLIYVDPPFNTGREQRRLTLATTRDGDGDRVGFGGRRYRTEVVGTRSYADSSDD